MFNNYFHHDISNSCKSHSICKTLQFASLKNKIGRVRESKWSLNTFLLKAILSRHSVRYWKYNGKNCILLLKTYSSLEQPDEIKAGKEIRIITKL